MTDAPHEQHRPQEAPQAHQQLAWQPSATDYHYLGTSALYQRIQENNALIGAGVLTDLQFNFSVQERPVMLAYSPTGSAEQTGTVTDYPASKTSEKALKGGMDWEQTPDTRKPSEKLQDFLGALSRNATNPDNYKQYIQGELDKLIGVGEGLNIAKEGTKTAAAAGFKALTDGTVADFLAKPNAINDPLFKTVANAVDAMGKDRNTTNKTLEALGTALEQSSEHYSALPNREKGHVIGQTMFGLTNLEGSTEAAEAGLKIADTVATHVDAAVIKTVEQSLKAIDDIANTAPDVAQQSKQMLFDYLQGKGLTGPELEYAGIPKGYFNEIEAQASLGKSENLNAMSDQAFRGDIDPYSAKHPKGWRKSHINDAGDLVPANPDGTYQGKEVTISNHLDGGWNKALKSNSPYTSFSASGDAAVVKYGDSLIKLDVKALKESIAAGEVTGVEVKELPEILKAIDESSCKETAKIKHRAWAIRDNEVLVKGVIPKRFFTVEKL